MESSVLNIQNVLENLSFIVRLKAWKDLTQHDITFLEFLYSNSNTNEHLSQKNYAKAKISVIKKAALEWIAHNQNTQINFQELLDEISSRIKSCSNSPELLSQKTMWDKCFSETYNAYEPYQKIKYHQERIMGMLVEEGVIEDIENIKVETNQAKGVNESYIVTDIDKQRKFYIKTFSEDSRLVAKGKIDPCEALVYKIMEYIELGPKTYFLIRSGSSSEGSLDEYACNYIVTEDLAIDGKIFKLDSISNKETFSQIYEEENFALNMQIASAVRDLLSIWDTFNANPSNYGMLFNSKNIREYGIKFVDHLPNANNGFFSKVIDGIKSMQGYSPRLRLQEDALEHKKNMSPLIEYAVRSKEFHNTESLKVQLITKILKEKDLYQAVTKARSDVEGLIQKHEVNFVEHADIELSTYIAKIYENIEIFKQILDATNSTYDISSVLLDTPLNIIEELKIDEAESGSASR